MALPGFYNENEGRAYPLVPFSSVTLGPDDPSPPVRISLPLDTLIDFGCLVGLDAEFDDARHVIYLHEVRRTGSQFAFDFRSNAPGLLDYALIFTRDVADGEYATGYAEATPLTGPTDAQGPLWEGFLVTGTMDSLDVVLPWDGALTASTGAQVEPALVQNLGLSYLRTINLANQDRTHALPPPGCPGDTTTDDYAYIVNATGLAGDLRFKEGYNLSIRQTARTNSLAFSAIQGAGAGAQCGEVPLYAGEQPPAGSTLLTGGPSCDEVVTSVNGLTASTIQLVPDLGTQIIPSPDDPNTLIVDFDRNNMTVCGPIVTIVEDLGDG
jgi:hypothetical protein